MSKRIRFIKSSGTLCEANITRYCEQPQEQFIKMFLPDYFDYIVVDEDKPADICFYSVQLEDESLLREDEINVFFSIENFEYWGANHPRKIYKHYNKFGAYGNKKKNIYISSNHSSIQYTEDYKIIPTIFCRIAYYNKVKTYWKQRFHVPFAEKKFILFTSQNQANNNKSILYNKLKTLGEIHYITQYPHLRNVSCYHSQELLEVYSQYKFIVSFENSHSDGYITEKIFNALMSQTIPIYDGAPNISTFINPKRFIRFDENIMKKVSVLMNNEILYNHIVSYEDINPEFQNISIDYNNAPSMNIALCFCVRNCEKHLPSIFKNIESLKTLNINVFSIFVFDNCSDNSEKLLRDYHAENMNHVILKGLTNKIPYRTGRVANARNACLDIVYNQLNDISFHIMIDCDEVNTPEWNIDIINKYFHNFDDDDWDCISFNRTGYYDIWALLYDDFRYHCWGFGVNSRNVTEIMKTQIENKLNTCDTNSIDVISGFCGFCIYKTDRFKDFYYDGTCQNFNRLLLQEDVSQTIQAFKKYNLDVQLFDCFGIECCEHLFYHLSAFRKGRKIKISKFIIVNEILNHIVSYEDINPQFQNISIDYDNAIRAGDYTSSLICEDYFTERVLDNGGLVITRKHINHNNISFDKVKYVCLTGYDSILLHFFENLLDKFESPVSVIIIESDVVNIRDTWLKHTKLKRCFLWNKPFVHPKLTCLPIGLNYSRHYESLSRWLSISKIDVMNDSGHHWLAVNYSPNTNSVRGKLVEKARTKWSEFCHVLDFIQPIQSYWKESKIEGKIKVDVSDPKCYDVLQKYKFILCPPGAGEDTHRTWETLYLGCIPIVQSSPLDELYADLPVVVINNWDEISISFLEHEYKRISLNKKLKKYDMSKIMMEYWYKRIFNDS